MLKNTANKATKLQIGPTTLKQCGGDDFEQFLALKNTSKLVAIVVEIFYQNCEESAFFLGIVLDRSEKR